jgi:hypothetical protein
VLIALSILLLAMGALGRVLTSGYTSSATISDQNRLQQAAQQATDAIMDKLRGATAFTSGDAGSVTALLQNGDTVRYRRQRDMLWCDTTAGTTQTHEPLSREVLAFSVAFYSTRGSQWEVAPAPAAASAVRVSVTVGSGLERATQTSAVKLRNKP